MWTRRKKPQASGGVEFLLGRPNQPRLKTYSAAPGLVYQYYFRGYVERETETGDREYVFAVSADRRDYHRVCVLIRESSVAEWMERRGRRLLDSERYAIAKMSLFAAMDNENLRMVEEGLVIVPDVREIDAYLTTLGRA